MNRYTKVNHVKYSVYEQALTVKECNVVDTLQLPYSTE